MPSAYPSLQQSLTFLAKTTGWAILASVCLLPSVSWSQQMPPSANGGPLPNQQGNRNLLQPLPPTRPNTTLPQPSITRRPRPQGNAPFQLNHLEQAFLDQVLNKWEQQSAKVETFKCPFKLWKYDAAFGPVLNGQSIPLTKEVGQVSYQKPDKGSFQIATIARWDAPKNTWTQDPKAIGEHWVSDGKNIYEYKQEQKKLHVRPIPPHLQGKQIVNGPLPFLFGAEADDLKKRYFLRILRKGTADEIWLQAYPKLLKDAANYRQVQVIIDRQKMLPKAIRLFLPDGSKSDYMFELSSASVNGRLDQLLGMFQAPRTPFGWTRVVEEAQPVRQLPPNRRPTQATLPPKNQPVR